MLFAIHCLDKPLSTALRSVTRDEHLAYVVSFGEKIRIAGPLMSDDGERMAGSFIVLEADSIDEARAWNANDPYMKVGLFGDVDIRPFNWTLADGKKREA